MKVCRLGTSGSVAGKKENKTDFPFAHDYDKISFNSFKACRIGGDL
jgi:hypothetical protein